MFQTVQDIHGFHIACLSSTRRDIRSVPPAANETHIPGSQCQALSHPGEVNEDHQYNYRDSNIRLHYIRRNIPKRIQKSKITIRADRIILSSIPREPSPRIIGPDVVPGQEVRDLRESDERQSCLAPDPIHFPLYQPHELLELHQILYIWLIA